MLVDYMEDVYARLVEKPVNIGALKCTNAIIMPCYNEKEIVLQHLELLAKQRTNNFDVLLVLSNIMDAKEMEKTVKKAKYSFGVVLLRRASDTGSAGGFYVGEKYALENGYKCVILADADALPIDRNLVEKLIEAHQKGNEIVLPKCLFMLDGKKVYEHRGPHFYGMISSNLLKKAGLHFAPLYLGADDSEFIIRMMKFAQIAYVESTLIHPARHSIFANFDRSVLYRINDMLLVIPKHMLLYLYSFSLIFPAYIIFGTSHTRKAGLHMLKCILFRKYGKDAVMPNEGGQSRVRNAETKFDIVVTPSDDAGKNIFKYEHSDSGIGKLFRMATAIAGRKTLLMPINNYAVLVSILFAKETWISERNEEYLISKNQNMVIHIVRLALFALLFPLFFSLGVLTFCANIVRKENTIGYGVKG